MTEDSTPAMGMDEGIFDTLYLLSQRYHSHGLYEPAAELLSFLLRHQPTHANLHFALGKALHAQGRHDRAVISYRQALLLGLPAIDVHLYLGQCLIFLARLDLAAAALRHFMALAQSQPVSSGLAAQLQRAGHLLNHVVLPRLRPGSDPGAHPQVPASSMEG